MYIHGYITRRLYYVCSFLYAVAVGQYAMPGYLNILVSEVKPEGRSEKKKKKRDSRARYVDVFTECLCVVAAPLPRHYTLLYAVGAAYLLLYYFMCVR